MDQDGDLERRAVEELLRETNRARVRAETMGPAGWMKCPLGSTNKRFLLNTLRPSARERRPAGQSGSHGTSSRRGEELRHDRSRETQSSDDEEHGHRKDYAHSHRDHAPSHRDHAPSHRDHAPSRSNTFSRDDVSSRDRSPPCRSSQSGRARSRSPVRDTPPAVKVPRERSHK